jgi:hypothetical protein
MDSSRHFPGRVLSRIMETEWRFKHFMMIQWELVMEYSEAFEWRELVIGSGLMYEFINLEVLSRVDCKPGYCSMFTHLHSTTALFSDA